MPVQRVTSAESVGGASEGLMRYGARRLGQPFDPASRELYETSAAALLRHQFLTRTIAGLGVRSIGR